jgi:protein Tex
MSSRGNVSGLYFKKIAAELNIGDGQVSAIATLFDEGATVPFIARYRKEATGSLDEVVITTVRDRLQQMEDLDKRRQVIISSLQERELLTPELNTKITAAEKMSVLEDLYLPFRPRRRTRATKARERGLEPLAIILRDQEIREHDQLLALAMPFVDPEKEVISSDQALAGARDIVAEWISENADSRDQIRKLLATEGMIESRVTSGKEEAGSKFKDYFDWSEIVRQAPSHRILAMFRGEKGGFLHLRIQVDQDRALGILRRRFIRNDSAAAAQVDLSLQDSYKRLLGPSLESEIRLELKQRADLEAIVVFASNLQELLLAPPLRDKRILAIDPGFRTGCKVVCLGSRGELLHNSTIYPHTGGRQAETAGTSVVDLCRRWSLEAVAIGNGTAGRETETFIRSLPLPEAIPVIQVNESGASIYSASDLAREEFPDHDITVRGAVSIGRRLQDPLAELVKIDPKSIGVGQYQHDVDQKDLKRSLDDVVISCVNTVGVDINSASKQLLTYISGLGPQLAQNIVTWRNEHGPFTSRKGISKVPRLGPRAFQQSAGFLRITEGANPLDSSAVHPESYHVVKRMQKDLRCTIEELMQDHSLHGQLDLNRYVSETVGLPTLRDIVQELARPGRDPREKFEIFRFAEGVDKIGDLEPGMILPGLVTNVTNFGAFVDVGVHQDGLVHISQLADRFVKNPADVVKVTQQVRVRVLEVDLPRNRISLSMKLTD